MTLLIFRAKSSSFKRICHPACPGPGRTKRSGGGTCCFFLSIRSDEPLIKVTALHFVIPSAAEGPAVRPGSRTKVSVPLVLPQNRHPERSASQIDRVTQRFVARSRRTPRMLNQRMLCRAFRPPKQQKIEKYTTSDRSEAQGPAVSLVGRQISGLLTSLAPWTGAPGSHQRTWEEKDGGEAPTKAFISISRFSYPWSESMRKKPFSTQVRWWDTTLGTSPGGKPRRGAGEAEAKGQPTAKQS